jgi:hypothetical protein
MRTKTTTGSQSRVEESPEVSTHTVPPSLDPIPLATQFCQLTKLFEQLQAEVRFLSSRVSQVESKNLSLRQMLQETQVQNTLQPPNDVIHAEILDLKNKHEEI